MMKNNRGKQILYNKMVDMICTKKIERPLLSPYDNILAERAGILL